MSSITTDSKVTNTVKVNRDILALSFEIPISPQLYLKTAVLKKCYVKFY